MSPNDPNLKVTRYELDHAGLYENNLIGDLMNYKDHEQVVKYLTDKIAMLEFVDMRRLLDEEEIARNPLYQVRDGGKIERMPTAVRGHCQDCQHAHYARTDVVDGTDVPLYRCNEVMEYGVFDPQWDRMHINAESGYETLVGHLFGCVNFQPREGKP